ncbi:hypothetical protein PC9H_004676 [Pleurotus ostreatus]|uniref:Peptidase S59 domain-containing protein n=1 Tax=Pleurotus ostreatus TaxID=5322 RepID=A0A8H6ZZ15_PLEOS|nr:uncharacterized protein PC9H_004676 [Pleurotus ostreatus]KAF7432733.1 hypothetical protein PC9H_004676 [Pleurotus ostreatus]KAJ8698732.1 hypothetical protein PTI98_005406 [Pleurotus ostreatus]
MFGNNTTSTWGNPQQNQQQQQPAGGSAFGQPNAFGNTGGAFGSTGAFGQPQQQPQANPMFGNLGGSTNTASPSGFGAFGGGTNNNNNQTTSAFGAPRPATGFGAFGGGTGTFGSTPAFGSTAAPAGTSGTSLFGQPNNTTTAGGAFGSNTGLFGASKPATTGFGTTQAQNQNGTNTVAAVTTGSSNPPYNAFTDKENPGSGTSVTLHYQSISCMPAYQGTSFEELRYQDYAQGRKTAGAFGQSATFGATPAQPTTSIFGQPQQSTPQPNAFGAPTTTPSTGFGAFGQSAATQTPQQSTGLFGGGAFGQPQQQQQPAQQTNAFGAFGQPAQQNQQPSGGLFGGGTTAFGQPKPAGTGFGTFGGGTFGSSATTTNAFGQPQQQQQQPATTGLFGQTQPAASNAFNAFGNTAANNAAKPLFGQPAAQPTQPAFGTGLFGQNQQQQQPAQQQQQQQQQPSLFGGGGGLFGSTNTQANQQNPQQPATNIFGATTAQQPNAGGGLFGGGGGLFGNNQQQQQQQQNQQPAANAFGAGGLFGKPAPPANNLFGGFGQQNTANTAQPQQSSLFGSTLGQSTNQQSTLGAGSLFGKPAAPAMGASTSNTNAPAGGLFGSFAPAGSFSATTTQGAQGTLTASIAEPIGNNLAIFSMLPPGPRSINLDPQPAKKKAGFFVDVPTRAPLPRVQLGYTPAASKLRGFASSTSNSTSGNPFSSMSFISGKAGALSLSRGDSKSPMTSDSLLRSQSPSLGSSQRQSVKKLILDKKVEPIDLFSKSGGSPARLGGSKVMFSPALSVAAREKEAAAAAAAAPSPQKAVALPAPRDQRTPSRLDTNNSQARNASPVTEAQKDPTALEEGDYWCKPDLDTLKGKGFQELSSFSGLVLGRKGYGEIHFLEPVDLTGLPKLGSLLGDVVRFDDKECSVYPDVDDVDKPPPGSGLNVKARLMLDRCWATDKASREPIKDEKHPSAVKHLKRLRNMKDTQFEGFDIKDGRWTFTVDHF